MMVRLVILENIRGVLARIDGAARRAGRDPAGVELAAVAKYASLEATAELLATGLVRHVAESRVQDAAAKAAALKARPDLPPARWRMIGHLQRNKARQALGVFDAVDSLDSLRLAQTLEEACSALGRTVPVLIQVKLTDKETQSGVAPEAVEEFLAALRRFPRLSVEGLLGIAPLTQSPEDARPHFRRLKVLFDRCFPGGRAGDGPARLSMGMSGDLEPAVEEGATMVRVGSALFAATALPQTP